MRTRFPALLAVLGVAAGCAPGDPGESPRVTVTTVVTAPHQGGVGQASAPEPGPEPEAPPVDDDEVGDAVERIAARLPAGTGLAVAPVGRANEVRVAGDLLSDVAWSTVKVPLAIAALRSSPETAGVAEVAITVSDNAAAEALWTSLGEGVGAGAGAGAAAAVESVLAETGDPATRVPAEQLRPGFSIFGQTQWSLADQARFGAGLACLPDAEPVRRMMQRIDRSQRWGLGSAPGAAFKGGWGPAADGSGYLVRQFGLLPTGDGMTSVAIAAYGTDLASGAGMLTGIADALADEAHALPSGRCS